MTIECYICFDKPVEEVRTLCNHCFCYECLQKWTKNNNTCPTCRVVLFNKVQKDSFYEFYLLLTLFSDEFVVVQGMLEI